MDDYVIVRISGPEVDIYCELNPEYKKYVVIENGQKVLYMRLVKAL
jgi:hypothetical protein